MPFNYTEQAKKLVTYQQDDQTVLQTPSSVEGRMLLALTCAVIGLTDTLAMQGEIRSRGPQG